MRRHGDRLRVVQIAAVAALLLLSGGAREARPAGQGVVAPAAGEALDAPSIARVLGSINSDLSEAQLERIAEAVVRYADKYALDRSLVTAVLLVESSARPWARSPKGALGLMQVMPYMMRPLGLAGSPSTVETNIEAGCIILADNIARLGEEDGISAYFWGSEIRGVAYLNRVQAARERVRAEIRS